MNRRQEDRGREQHRSEKGNGINISEKRRDKVAGGGTGRTAVGVVRTLQVQRNLSYTLKIRKAWQSFGGLI